MLIRGLTVKGIEVRSTSSAISSDEYFNLVSLLLPGTGTNGAQNNTFVDGSTNNFTVTRNGNTTQGTFSPFSQTGWGNFFNGSSRLDVATSAAFATGTGSFTVEAWVYVISGTTSGDGYLSSWTNNTGNGFSIGGYTSGGNYLINFSIGTGASANVALSSAITLNTWHHVAGVRDGSTMTLYIDGVAVSTTSTSRSIDRTVCSIGSIYGAAVGGGYYLNGYVSNVRFVSSAVYTSNFTPSTSPLTAIANTQLLTAQSNRFVDNSGNSRAITVGTGSPSVQAFAPFDPTTAYSAGAVGGSGYFDGTGDYLTVPDNAAWDFGTGDFTIETWVYPNTSGTLRVIAAAFSSSGNEGWSFELTSGNLLTFYAEGAYLTTSSGSVIANTWAHVVASRSGTSLRLFINGVIDGSVTNSTDISGSTAALTVAATPSGTQLFTGYQANFRVVKGTAVYTTAFTPPTAPVTAIANTSLLLNYTNAGITDATAKNVLETVGSAQISTTQSKFGGSSMSFDGSGDYLIFPSAQTQNFVYGTGNFTIEFWFYMSALAGIGYYVLYDGRPASTTGAYVNLAINNATPESYVNGATVISGSPLSANTWYHFAYARSGSSTKMFINGTQVGSTYTDNTNYINAANRPVIGTNGFTLGDSNFNGYIDDLRITKGYARYTANFTPSTTAFPTQ
jgi:hypothetical protein